LGNKTNLIRYFNRAGYPAKQDELSMVETETRTYTRSLSITKIMRINSSRDEN